MVMRVLISSSDVLRVLDSADKQVVKNASDAFEEIKRETSTYPSFNAIVNVFGPVRHAQKMPEEADSPTLVMVLPVL